MRDFATLFQRVDQTTRTTRKVAAMADYFRTAPDADKLWCVALFSGRRPRRVITTTVLREWAAERAGIPLWLFEESYPIVGDLAETIALVLPPAPEDTLDLPLSHWIAEIARLSTLDDAARRAGILAAWDALGDVERFLFTKLLTGGFRIGVSQTLTTRALAQATGQPEADLAHKLMGDWTPQTTTWHALIEADDPTAAQSRPYPFYLAYQVEEVEALGPPSDWQVERKWDGIRGQFIARGGTHYLWSRGEELVTDRYPELGQVLDHVPDGTVLDAEILAYRDDRPLPFNALQKRIGRKTVSRKLMEDSPVVLMAYDLLEDRGEDIRALPLSERRARLEGIAAAVPAQIPLRLSPIVTAPDWDGLRAERARSRELASEGLMLKRRTGPYLSGRRKGDWWKWKVDPLTVDAVMVYAQSGTGRRANLFTDFTFAVRDGDALVPFTKAYSGLTDAEFRRITHWVRRNTLARYGPVRHVKPEHVFEIAFEGIQESPRHKSGITLRFPRMLRWRQDKPPAEADTLDHLRDMLKEYG
ncbi:MAG: ATP-dependent DNA ligase [Paracoccaceae bacterium]